MCVCQHSCKRSPLIVTTKLLRLIHTCFVRSALYNVHKGKLTRNGGIHPQTPQGMCYIRGDGFIVTRRNPTCRIDNLSRMDFICRTSPNQQNEQTQEILQ